MIKLKNLWKIALATMAMSAMLVACDTTSNNNESEESGVTPGFYLSGLNGSDWAGDTDPATAHLMTKGEGEVYTFTFTAESANPFPYGFKISTENGWMEQYQAYNEAAPTATFTILESNKEAAVYYSTKAKLEAADEDGNKPADDATKFTVAATKVYKIGSEYTITFDKVAMKIKISGEFDTVKTKTIKVTIKINDTAKLILTDVPVYEDTIDNKVNGSLFAWAGGTEQAIEVTDCEVTADWTGAEKNTWVAEQAPADTVAGADAWAKLFFTAAGEGWIPYSTTGEFTYSWTNKK
jgi:hypothetical protein